MQNSSTGDNAIVYELTISINTKDKLYLLIFFVEHSWLQSAHDENIQDSIKIVLNSSFVLLFTNSLKTLKNVAEFVLNMFSLMVCHKSCELMN